MDFTRTNENPGGVSSGVMTSDGTRGQIIAARQVTVCICKRGKATDTGCEFDEKRRLKNSAKVQAALSDFQPAKASYCKPLPTLKRLLELFSYDPETGVLTWKVSRGGQRAGDVAGTISHGYVQVFVDGIAYRAHRLIWKMVTGREPVRYIDHENGNRSDNRLIKNDPSNSNLREVTPWENNLNRCAPAGSNTRHLGVSWQRQAQTYLACIGVGGTVVKLGTYSCLRCAVDARAHAFGLLVGTPANDNDGGASK